MGGIHPLIRRPLSEEATQLLDYLLRRRREGDLQPPLVRDAAGELDTLVPVVRTAAEELHERRLAVLLQPGIVAPVAWPRLTAVSGRGVHLHLTDQLTEVGAAPPEALAEAWTDGEGEGDWPAPEPTGDSPADEVWLALRAAHHGDLAGALEACRRATAATLRAGVIPLLARLAGWLDRLLTAARAPESPALRYEPPGTENATAGQYFQEGWEAEIIRSRERAQAAYIEALRTDPGFDGARLRYAQVTFDLGEPNRALAELARLTQARPRLGAAHLLRAAMLLDLAEEGAPPEGWDEQAAAHIRAALADERADASLAHALEARRLSVRGEAEAAAKAARGAIARQPGQAGHYHLLGLALAPTADLVAAAWAEAAAVLADHDFIPAAETLFSLRQSPQVAGAVPHARQLIDETWQ